jgi:DNA polymerase elongation subunit (family B)
LKLYKKFTYSEKNSYTLDNIANIELGRKKLKFDGTLDELYETDINKFIKYNLNDVMLLVELENKMKFIEVALAICHIGHIPYEGIYSQSRIVDSAVLTYMKRKEIVAPNAHPSNKEGEFKGAYVKTPQVGLHRYVYDLDFSSLYPSAIITLNISPETKITKIDD